MLPNDWLQPDWPAPPNVCGCMTTRAGGVSQAPYASFNLAGHVGDDARSVAENRSRLRRHLPAEPLWLTQVHGDRVAEAGIDAEGSEADASVARAPNRVCAVMTADCLPVLFCDAAGTVVAAAHAGWRGLAGGVLERAVEAMRVPPETVMAWLGAAIGPDSFEVGPEVREAFIAHDRLAATAFRPAMPGTLDEVPRKWLADIYALARLRLARIGVTQIYGGGLCTLRDAERFYSYRREQKTGRMASLVWLQD